MPDDPMAHRLWRVVFELLLDLLGEALSSHIDKSMTIEATSIDGSLIIELTPLPDTNKTARLRTSHGILTGPDFRVSIRRVS